jgi:Flp pilus assembly protein TadD
MARSRPLHILLLVLITTVTGWTYGGVRGHELLNWDDKNLILTNPYIYPTPQISEFWKAPYQNLYMPITYSTWALLSTQAHTFHADTDDMTLDPRPFHIANWVLHTCNAILVFLILIFLLRHLNTQWSAISIAMASAAGALLWSLHPLQVESVSWITGLKEVMTGTFSFLSIWFYLLYAGAQKQRGANSGKQVEHAYTFQGGAFYMLASLSFVFALLSKPSAVIIPLMVVVLDIGILRRSLNKVWLATSVWFLMSGVFVLVAQKSQPLTEITVSRFWDRPLVFIDAVGFYLSKVLWPLPLITEYGRTPQWVLEHKTFLLTGLLSLVSSAIVWRQRSRSWLWISFVIFVIGFLPTSGLIPFGYQFYSTVADRYLYTAMLGPAIALAYLLTRFQRHRWLPVAALSCLIFLSFLSQKQVRVWRNDISLWTHVLKVNPNSWSARTNLGLAYSLQGDSKGAAEHYRQALLLKPAAERSLTNIGAGMNYLGKTAQAITVLEQVILQYPRNSDALINLAAALENAGRQEEARLHLTKAVQVAPQSSLAQANLGRLLVSMNRVDQGVSHLRLAVTLNPNATNAWKHLGMVLGGRGELEEAKQCFERVLAAEPHDFQALYNLGVILKSQGLLPRAVEVLRTAIQSKPGEASAHDELAVALAQTGAMPEAEAQVREALRLSPTYAKAYYNLGVILAMQNRIGEAVAAWKQALVLQPDMSQASAALKQYEEKASP